VDNELEVIRHQMEEKRASLADKLDLLENQVLETVHEATAGVNQIVENVTSTVGAVTDNVQDTMTSVKETLAEGVQDTVDAVKDTFNVSEHVRKHPWAALGCSFAVGLAGGYLLRRPSSNGSRSQPRPEPHSQPQPTSFAASTPAREEPSPLEEAAKTALTSLKGLAIGALMGVIREVATKSLPASLEDEVASMLNQVNAQLGGKNLADFGVMEALQGHPKEESNGADRQRADSGRVALRANGRDF